MTTTSAELMKVSASQRINVYLSEPIKLTHEKRGSEVTYLVDRGIVIAFIRRGQLAREVELHGRKVLLTGNPSRVEKRIDPYALGLAWNETFEPFEDAKRAMLKLAEPELPTIDDFVRFLSDPRAGRDY